MQSLVMYIDEHLTTNNTVPEASNKHEQIGGLVLISTLMSFFGALIFALIPHDSFLPLQAILLSFISAIPMAIGSYIAYFYLLLKFPIQQVAPIFQLSTAWLLIFEIMMGKSISVGGFFGIILLLYGSYVLDTATFKWKIPTQLLILSIPATFIFAVSQIMVRLASFEGSAISISSWQMLGMGCFGVILLIVKPYRTGLINRVKNQGKRFLGLSLINESLAEGSFLFNNLAIAVAPIAAYITALMGMQSVFIALMLFFFPLGKRSIITRTQWFSIILITIGVFLVELQH